MIKKLLYITCANKEQYSGGSQCAKRNRESLLMLLGEENVVEYIIRPYFGKRSLLQRLQRLKDIFNLLGGGLSTQDIGNIVTLLHQEDFTDVFIDSSLLGILAKIIKKILPNINIYVFFHNVEYDYMLSTTLYSRDYRHLFWIVSAKYNEGQASRHADHIISLNETDRQRIKTLYHKDSTVIPITMKDDYYDLNEAEHPCQSTIPQALFVGSYFAGNIKGLKYFCTEVLPQTNIHLTIIGSGMEQFAKDTQINDKITLLGKVEELAPYYEKADFVILPIISGGGMKVKTAEALKYGKHIIGTKEALEGYLIEPEIADECNTTSEFLYAIGHFREHRKFKYQSQARQIFKQRYSFESSLTIYKKCLQL